jgi:thiol-disulfide isomerase/thioredoxin
MSRPVTPQEKGNWIRRLITFALIGAAVAGGLFFALPSGWWKRFGKEKEKSGLQVTKENLAQVQSSPGKLTVTNMMLDGNPDSAKLKEVLEKLQKEKYGAKVVLAELDASEQPELAASQGVDVEKFAGQLDFHANGRKLGELLGQTDPKVVELTIDRMLAGLLQRIDKNWLPDVPGMERDRGQKVIDIKPAPPAKPAPEP